MTQQRGNWTFGYTAEQVLEEGVRVKLAFHKSRLDAWSAQSNATEKKLRENGVVVDRSAIAPAYSNSGRANTITLDNSLMRDFYECEGKIEEHRLKIKEYGGWEQVLVSQGQTTLQLTHEDWLFFFGQNLDPHQSGEAEDRQLNHEASAA